MIEYEPTEVAALAMLALMRGDAPAARLLLADLTAEERLRVEDAAERLVTESFQVGRQQAAGTPA